MKTTPAALLAFGLFVAVLLVAGLAGWHEKHYSRRHLVLLEARVNAIERILTEDRTL